MEIRPIHTEFDHESALKEIDSLMESIPGTPEGDRLDILVTLVEAYEAKNFPIPEPDNPVGVVEYYTESRGLDHTDQNNKKQISEILTKKRSLSLRMIRRLHIELGIPVGLLIEK